MSKELKQMRGQVRQIVKELLPEIFAAELKSALYKELAKELSAKLVSIDTMVKDSLGAMNERQKDVQGLLMRAIAESAAKVAPSVEPQPLGDENK